MFVSKYNVEDYDTYLIKYKEISVAQNKYLSSKDLIRDNYLLPNWMWFVKNCTNENIKSFKDFVEWCGFIPQQGLSKDKTIEVIYTMQSKLDRPLIYNDFLNPSIYEVGIGYVIKYWGNVNNMKRELNLEINRENMITRTKPLEDILKDIKEICGKVYNEKGISIISINDFNDCKSINHLEYQTCYKHLKNNNMDIGDYINKLGFDVIDSGCGMVYKYKDGETTLSRYELQFSNFLRECGLVYNIDYFRDFEYSKFIKDYNGCMNCDYVLKIGGSTIYVEIAGFLTNYDKHYYSDIKIKSKSKEKYRLSLKQKEIMLKSNGLSYYIVFPQSYPKDKILEEDMNQIISNVEHQYRKSMNG